MESPMNEWLTLNEAAAYLKIQPRTLAVWARQKKVPAHRLSGIQRCIWRFLRPELDAMLCVSSADSAHREGA
jgi:excisionase family DNA binding protein